MHATGALDGFCTESAPPLGGIDVETVRNALRHQISTWEAQILSLQQRINQFYSFIEDDEAVTKIGSMVPYLAEALERAPAQRGPQLSEGSLEDRVLQIMQADPSRSYRAQQLVNLLRRQHGLKVQRERLKLVLKNAPEHFKLGERGWWSLRTEVPSEEVSA
jgi:hypothetical protein